MKPITVHQAERGVVYSVGVVAFHSPNDMPGLGGEALRSTLSNLAERDAPLHDEMLPERIAAKRRQLFAGVVMPVAGRAIGEARRAKSETLEADARQREPVLSIDPVLAVEMRAAVRSLDPPAQHAWVEAANLAGLTVTAVEGNPANLAGPIYERAQERYWLENWIARHNAESGHPAEPNVETVLATGPNSDAVRDEAQSYHKANADRLAEIDAMEASAKSLVAFLAALFDLSAGEALDMALGRDRAAA